VLDFFQAKDIERALSYPTLVDALKQGFSRPGFTPDRTVSSYDGVTLLTKPSFGAQQSGVKLVTVSPSNSSKNIPTIQGVYYLFDTSTGEPLAIMDAQSLTNIRTAAASVLAASFLASPDARSLLVVGSGELSPYMIAAYCACFPIQHVLVYGRDSSKALKTIERLGSIPAEVQIAENLESAAMQADIISCVTSSTIPLILGKWLHAGQHVDLVGAFTPEMRESDIEAIRRSQLFVDNLSTAFSSGDLSIPLNEGVITEQDIQGDLFSLCSDGEEQLLHSANQITLFKSVGHALEDLIAAQLVYKFFQNKPS
jgi:ornithine cyclodeaminase/alanine dehydrogenase-like protein (mu-crystallin family)